MNANDAMLNGLATAQTGSRVQDGKPNATRVFDLIIAAVAGSGLGRSGAPYALTILRPACAAVSGIGPDCAAVMRRRGGDPC